MSTYAGVQRSLADHEPRSGPLGLPACSGASHAVFEAWRSAAGPPWCVRGRRCRTRPEASSRRSGSSAQGRMLGPSLLSRPRPRCLRLLRLPCSSGPSGPASAFLGIRRGLFGEVVGERSDGNEATAADLDGAQLVETAFVNGRDQFGHSGLLTLWVNGASGGRRCAGQGSGLSPGEVLTEVCDEDLAVVGQRQAPGGDVVLVPVVGDARLPECAEKGE